MVTANSKSNEEKTLQIATENDVIQARELAKTMAKRIEMSITDATKFVTVISELGRNMLNYAGGGVITFEFVSRDGRSGIRATFIDHGPGIESVEEAMQEGFSTFNGLGLGLPGSKRLSDYFEIHSILGEGTLVIIEKMAGR